MGEEGVKKPANEAKRISVAMGYCGDCEKPYRWVGGTAPVRLAIPPNACVGNGSEYECRLNTGRMPARRAGRWT
jgi:hypothetical protein